MFTDKMHGSLKWVRTNRFTCHSCCRDHHFTGPHWQKASMDGDYCNSCLGPVRGVGWAWTDRTGYKNGVFTCDRCGRKDLKGPHWHAPLANQDYCNRCLPFAPKDYETPGEVGGKGWQWTDSTGYHLNRFTCEKCGKKDLMGMHWHAPSVKQDYCGMCVPLTMAMELSSQETTSTAASSSGATVRKMPAIGEIWVLTDSTGYPGGFFTCDKCGRKKLSGKHWHSPATKHDFCVQCCDTSDHPRAIASSVAMGQCWVLTDSAGYPRGFYTCDKCGRQELSGKHWHSPATKQDFCPECCELSAHPTAVPAELISSDESTRDESNNATNEIEEDPSLTTSDIEM